MIVMGSSKGWPFFCWLGGRCQPFRGADSSLASRGPQWESPSDLCTLETDGHLILRVDINIGDNLSGQERPLGAPRLNSSPLSAHSVEKGSHGVESCLCHWLAWANPISLQPQFPHLFNGHNNASFTWLLSRHCEKNLTVCSRYGACPF